MHRHIQFLTISLIISLTTLAHAASYKLTLINYQNQPTSVVAISQDGKLVLGDINDTGSLFLYHPKTLTYTALNIAIPGSISITPTGIMSLGVVTGYYSDGSGEHGFFSFGSHVYSPIDFPGSVNTEIMAINDYGDTVGNYTDGAQNVHSFKRTVFGRFRSFDFPAVPNGDCNPIPNTIPLAVGINRESDHRYQRAHL
jgi:hypothetical protein